MTYSIDLKNRVVRAYTEKHLSSCRHVQRVFNVPKTTVHRWVRTHPITIHMVHRQSRFSELQQQVDQYVRQHPFSTCKEIVQHLHGSIRPSLTSGYRLLRKLDFTRKTPSVVVKPPDTKLSDRRAAFSHTIHDIDVDRVVSIDESSFCMGFQKMKGYAKRGKRQSDGLHQLEDVSRERSSLEQRPLAFASDIDITYRGIFSHCWRLARRNVLHIEDCRT